MRTPGLVFSLLLILCLWAPSDLWAQGTFGAEFTMSSSTLRRAPLTYPTPDDDISTEFGRKTIQDFADRVKRQCPGCQVEPTRDRYELPAYRVTLPDGFRFHITLDPAVIEIVPDAATLEGFKRLEKILDPLVFGIGQSLGQAPITDLGGGHIHLGIRSHFQGNPVLFRNFMVDWMNHPDLMSALTGSKYNSPTFLDLPSGRDQAFRSLLAEFDQRLQREGFLEKPGRDPARGEQLMVEFARALQTRVYTETLIQGWTPTEKYQAVNVTRLADDKVPWSQKTVELRFLAGQKSVNEFIELAWLFEGRIEFLKTKKGLIQHQPLQRFSISQTVSRLEAFTREAGSRAHLIRESLSQDEIRRAVPSTGGPRCARIWP